MPKPELTPEQHTKALELLQRTAESQKVFLQNLYELQQTLGLSIDANLDLAAVPLNELLLASELESQDEEIGLLPCLQDDESTPEDDDMDSFWEEADQMGLLLK